MTDTDTATRHRGTASPSASASASTSIAGGSGDMLDLDGRRALGTVLERLMGRRADVTVGRYELGKRIGAGGCGAVYEARDPRLDRKVAIKVVLPSRSRAQTGEAEARLLREAQALAKLGHPNIVEIFDLGADEVGRDRHGRERRGVYIVMELLEGSTLRHWLRTCPPRAQITHAFVQAARGLAAAHALGVVHRDFKPANAIRTPDGHVKVLDFGLARDELEAFSSHTTTGPWATAASSTESLTRTGTVMGTPRYMAPEQHAAGLVTPASDQYALCVALWEALCEAPPYDAEDIETLAALKDGGPPSRPTVLPPALHRVLARGLDPDPARRFSDLGRLAVALERAAAPVRRARWAALASVLALVGVGAVAATPEGPRTPLCETADSTDGWQARFDAAIEHTRADPQVSASMPRRVEARLHRFADAWGAARADVCEASDVGSTALATRAACLERGRLAFGQALDRLDADPLLGRRRLLSMPVPSRCLVDDAEALYALDDAQERELDEHSALATAVLEGQRASDAATTEAITAALARVDALGDHWVAARLLLARIHHDVAEGRATEAARAATEALWRAEAAGDALLAAELVTVVTAHLVDADAPDADLQRLFAHGDDLLRAAGDPQHIRVELEAVQALDASRRGRLDEALRLSDAAVARAGDPPLPGTERMVALALITAAGIRAGGSERPAARRSLRRVLAWGLDDEPWYPYLAGFAHDILSGVAVLDGDLEGAIEASIAQQHWLAKAAGPDNPVVLHAAARYGRMLVWQGADAEGMALMERAYDRIVDTQGALDLKLAYLASELADAERLRGDHARALHWAERALEHETTRVGADHPAIADAWVSVADAQVHTGAIARAKASLDEAEARLDPDDAYTAARAEAARASLCRADGRLADARRHAQAGLVHLGVDTPTLLSAGLRGELWRTVADTWRAEGDAKAADDVDRIAEEALSHGTWWHRSRG